MNVTTVPATRLLGVVGIALLVGLGWLALIGPATGAITETGDARLEAQDRAHGMGVQLAQLRRQAAELPETDAQARLLDEMWPATADQPGFFAQVAGAATDAGIDLDDITVLSPSVPQRLDVDPNAAAGATAGATGGTEGAGDDVGISDIAVQAVTIGAEGTYTELTTLLAKLEKMPRAFLVGSVTLDAETNDAGTGGTGADTLSLTVVGRTFVAPPLDPPPAS
ncbi:hypothetical protein [Nocardioides dongxiaopingii]|uniref:hypothetical protein n=1 Tax=Nocardioides dongxiaopingii TaxID=2576036 RepID=UPI0014852251|nr:hypothetical protein [Nocardioides dongxiaopingii]